MANTFIQVSPMVLSRRMPTIPGALILGIMAVTGVMVVQAYLPEQNLPPTPLIIVSRSVYARVFESCKVGEVCSGPTVAARDPEGESLTYRFYDRVTKQPIGQPIMAESGKPITPTFRFNEPGEKRIYMVVEDGAGHAAPDYPIVIPVQGK